MSAALAIPLPPTLPEQFGLEQFDAANGNYRYDGNLKRVKSVVNGKVIYNIYDASGALMHVNATRDGTVTDYVSGPAGALARYSNNAVTYLHPDHLGSANAGTTASGTIAWRERYTPFGEEIVGNAANDNQAGFTGHIKDSATGLNYMQARYFDPTIGRFLSIDPMDFMSSGYDPGYFNRYMYTMNNPINATDPTGMTVCDEGDSDCTDEVVSTGTKLQDKVNNFMGALTGFSLANRGEAEDFAEEFGEKFKEQTKENAEKIGNCAADHFGLGGPAAIAAGGPFVPKKGLKGRLGLGAGAKNARPFANNTSVISAASRAVFGDAKFKNSNALTRATGTKSVGGAIGRLGSRGATGAGVALLAVDAAQIGDCVKYSD